MIVSWGGQNASGEIQSIKGDYINYKFIQKKFRNKFEDQLIKRFDDQALAHDFAHRMDFMRLV